MLKLLEAEVDTKGVRDIVSVPGGGGILWAGPHAIGKSARMLTIAECVRGPTNPYGLGGLSATMMLKFANQREDGSNENTFSIRRQYGKRHSVTLQLHDGRKIERIREVRDWIQATMGTIALVDMGSVARGTIQGRRETFESIVGTSSHNIRQAIPEAISETEQASEAFPSEVSKVIMGAIADEKRDPQVLTGVLLAIRAKQKEVRALLKDASGANRQHQRQEPDGQVGTVAAEEERRTKYNEAMLLAREQRAQARLRRDGPIAEMRAIEALKAEMEALSAEGMDAAEWNEPILRLKRKLKGLEPEVKHAGPPVSKEDLSAARRETAILQQTLDNLQTQRLVLEATSARAKKRADNYAASKVCPVCGGDGPNLGHRQKQVAYLATTAAEEFCAIRDQADKISNQLIKSEVRRDNYEQTAIVTEAVLGFEKQIADLQGQKEKAAKRFQTKNKRRRSQLVDRIADLEQYKPLDMEEMVRDIEAAEARAVGADADLKASEARLVQLREAAVSERLWMNNREKEQEHEKMLAHLGRAADALGPRGVLLASMGPGLQQFVSAANEAMGVYRDTDQFYLDVASWTWGIRRGDLSIPHAACSKAERMVLGFAIGYATANLAPWSAVFVDDLDALLEPLRGTVVRFLDTALDDGRLDNVFLACAMKKQQEALSFANEANLKNIDVRWVQ